MEDNVSPSANKQLLLITGLSAAGKSASLMNIPDQESWMYLNTESGKQLPFANKFNWNMVKDKSKAHEAGIITYPEQVFESFEYAIKNPEKVNGIVIDSLTFLMEMYESQYIYNSPDSRAAWGHYNQFFKSLMQNYIPRFGKPVIMTAHIKEEYDDSTMTMKTSVPVKGALKNVGIEAYFSTIIMATTKRLEDLEAYKNPLLTITEDDEDYGVKHVFQTRPTKQTPGYKIRSPIGLFPRSHTFTDNNAHLILDWMTKYYNQHL